MLQSRAISCILILNSAILRLPGWEPPWEPPWEPGPTNPRLVTRVGAGIQPGYQAGGLAVYVVYLASWTGVYTVLCTVALEFELQILYIACTVHPLQLQLPPTVLYCISSAHCGTRPGVGPCRTGPVCSTSRVALNALYCSQIALAVLGRLGASRVALKW